MTRILTTAILLILSGVIFFIFTDPLITDPVVIKEDGSLAGGVLVLKEEKKTFKNALADARLLKTRISELDAKLAKISDAEINRLDDFLPDTMDEIQLIVDLSKIASLSGMTIRDINVIADDTSQRDKDLSAQAVNPELKSLSLSFSTTGSYSQFKIFVSNIAKSLRIMDIQSISFNTEPDSSVATYNIELTTYWIK